MVEDVEDTEKLPLNLAISEAYQQDDFAKDTIVKLREGARVQKGFPLAECREVDSQICY